jgi:transposase InsO family protein
MKDTTTPMEDSVALFRYGVISDLLHLPLGTGKGLWKRMQEKAERSYVIPGSARTTVAAETIRNWLDLYREGGFDALKPRRREDAGRSRSLPQEVLDLLVHLKEERHELTVPQVIAAARQHTQVVPEGLALPLSTVHRHLSRAGVMKKRPTDPSAKDLRRFAFEKAGELWMSDVMHGPAVRVDGRRKQKTYLIGFIDDATRVVPFARFALSENTASFLPVLREAVLRRGIPRRLYVDNGSAFVSRHLAIVCARLGITLIHARPYHAAGKGKQERWFRTVRMSFLPTLKDEDFDSLTALNSRLWQWVEGEYHQAAHRGLAGLAPFDAWAMHSDEVRLPGPELDLRELFLLEEKRKVQKDRTVSLHGTVYEVDAVLVGETVSLRFDPAKPGAPIDVWLNGKKVQAGARTVDVFANCHVKRDHGNKILAANCPPDLPAARIKLGSIEAQQEAR